MFEMESNDDCSVCGSINFGSLVDTTTEKSLGMECKLSISLKDLYSCDANNFM